MSSSSGISPFEKIFAMEKEQEPAIRLLEKGGKGDTSLKIYKDRKWQLDGAVMVLCSKDNQDDFEMEGAVEYGE